MGCGKEHAYEIMENERIKKITSNSSDPSIKYLYSAINNLEYRIQKIEDAPLKQKKEELKVLSDKENIVNLINSLINNLTTVIKDIK